MSSRINEPPFWKYLLLLVRPAIFATIASLAWYFVHTYISFPKSDQGIFEPILSVIAIAHGLIASMQISRVADQRHQIKVAQQLKDRARFDENSCIVISPEIKILLATFSLLFWLLFMMYPFNTIHTGLITEWVVIFVLYLLWEVASQLDDPFNGVWKISSGDIEEIFGPKKDSTSP